MGLVQVLPRFLLPRLSWVGASATTLGPASALLAHPMNSRPWPNPNGIETTRAHHSGSRAKPRQMDMLRTPSFRRAFHATPARRRDHHFDTLKFVQRLQEEGFTEEQSVAMM